jgi:hypothetical protein
MSIVNLECFEDGASSTTKLAWCNFSSNWITCNEQGELLNLDSNRIESKTICDGTLTAIGVSPSNDSFAVAFDESVYVRNFVDCTEDVKKLGRRSLPISQISYSSDGDLM